MTGEGDRSVITQPEAVPLIQVPMLEPSDASQKSRKTGSLSGAHAPEAEGGDFPASVSVGVLTDDH
jgi:hypothetical protein